MKWTFRQIFCWHKWKIEKVYSIQSAYPEPKHIGWMKVCIKCKRFKHISDEQNQHIRA